MDSGSNCSICFEAFGKSPFGACAPCGHCFHHECFGKWEAQCKTKQTSDGTGSRNRQKKTIPCPNCQQATTSFVKKLFLNISGHAPRNDDESFDTAPGNGKETAKWKKEADELKVSERSLRKSCQELSTERLKVVSERASLDEKVASLQARCTFLAREAKNNSTVISETLVAAERTERLRNELEKERRELKAELRRRKEDTYALKEALANIKEKYATDLAKLETQGMVEIEEVLSQHPKLKQENHALRAELAMKTKEAEGLKSRLRMKVSGNKNGLEMQAKCTPQHRVKKAEKVAREMQHVRREEDQRRQLLKRKHSEQSQEGVSRKRLSANATRIVRAAKRASPAREDTASLALSAPFHNVRAVQDSISPRQQNQRGSDLTPAVERQSQLQFHNNDGDSSDDDKPIQSRSSLSGLLNQESPFDTEVCSSDRPSAGPQISLHLSRTKHRKVGTCRQSASSGAVVVGPGGVARLKQTHSSSKSHQELQAGRRKKGNDIRAMFRNQNRER